VTDQPTCIHARGVVFFFTRVASTESVSRDREREYAENSNKIHNSR